MKYRVIVRTTDHKKRVARLNRSLDEYKKTIEQYIRTDWQKRGYVSFDYVDAGIYYGFNPANIASITVKAGWWF